jgi:Methyltransferase domain
MGPEQPLPLPREFADAESYIASLLRFGTSSHLLQTLCGGVHILDFFTKEPDLYSLVLPETWREWFKSVEIADLLDLLMREDLAQFDPGDDLGKWRNAPSPPESLIRYIRDVRMHCLNRELRIPKPAGVSEQLSRKIAVGMKPKKIHEVDYFARYVSRLTSTLSSETGLAITHLVDFGSGQNFLGRALASSPFNKSVIAVESRPHVVQVAKNLDVLANIVPKPKVIVDKKKFRAAVAAGEALSTEKLKKSSNNPFYTTANGSAVDTSAYVETVRATLELQQEGKGSVQYVEHSIKDGDLSAVVDQIVETPNMPAQIDGFEQQRGFAASTKGPALMVVSIHSCGNLLHHGLRTLTMNPSVHAVAMIGCCYNLMTERLGPPTYKIPALRPHHPRLDTTSNACDQHGFPMSRRFCGYKHKVLTPRSCLRTQTEFGSNGAPCEITEGEEEKGEQNNYGTWETGIRLNITSRMMAVQAPQNWGLKDSGAFFTRHFFRAVLQRIFLDKGIVSAPPPAPFLSSNGENQREGSLCYVPGEGRSPAGTGVSDAGGTDPIIIGTLGKPCYKSFVSYVRAAVAKLTSPNSPSSPAISCRVAARVGAMTDDEILEYETKFRERKKDLSVVWSLMAFSATVAESMIVVDRWLWLTEQEEVGKAWVENVFDYGQSPRNLVVVGIRQE